MRSESSRHKWKRGFEPHHTSPARPPEHMSHYLGDLKYPSRKADLIEQAKAAGAPSDVLHVLRSLGDRMFTSAAQVVRIAEQEY